MGGDGPSIPRVRCPEKSHHLWVHKVLQRRKPCLWSIALESLTALLLKSVHDSVDPLKKRNIQERSEACTEFSKPIAALSGGSEAMHQSPAPATTLWNSPSRPEMDVRHLSK